MVKPVFAPEGLALAEKVNHNDKELISHRFVANYAGQFGSPPLPYSTGRGLMKRNHRYTA
jgi:hypothetical protein